MAATETTTRTVTLDYLDPTDVGALYCHYEGQHQPQDCYVALDTRTGHAWADYNGEIGNAVPMDVWHRLTLRWSIPILQAASANELLADLRLRFEAVLAGYTSHWDGSNTVGQFTDDALAAISDIGSICRMQDPDFIYVLDAGDWLSPAEPAIRNLHAAGASLDEIVTEFQGRGTGEGDEYIVGIEDAIREIVEG